MKKILLIALFFFLSEGTATADSLLRPGYESPRATGMGNAFIAIADDSNCLFYNPAVLARIDGFHYNVLDFTLGVDSLDTLNRLKAFVFENDTTNLLRQDSEYIRFGFRNQFIRRYFGFGVYHNTQAYINLTNISLLGVNIPNVDLYGVSDSGLVVGMGLPVGKYFSFGGSLRAIYRVGMDTTISAFDLISEVGLSNSSQFMQAAYTNLINRAGTGMGFGVNVGIHSKFPLGGKNVPELALGATIEDLGGTNFTAVGTATAPPSTAMTYNAGAALIYHPARHTHFTLAADFRHLFENIPLHKQTHFGMELRHKWFGLRGGLYQGNITYGASFEALPHTKVHFSSYAPSLGDTWGSASQRWYLVQVAIGFNPL